MQAVFCLVAYVMVTECLALPEVGKFMKTAYWSIGFSVSGNLMDQ